MQDIVPRRRGEVQGRPQLQVRRAVVMPSRQQATVAMPAAKPIVAVQPVQNIQPVSTPPVQLQKMPPTVSMSDIKPPATRRLALDPISPVKLPVNLRDTLLENHDEAPAIEKPVQPAKPAKTISKKEARREKKRQTKTAKVQKQRRSFLGWIKGLTVRDWITGILIALILGVTGYVAYDTWATNNSVKEMLTSDVSAAEAPDATPEERQTGEGKDERDIAADRINAYKTAPDQPRVLTIDKIGVRSRVLDMNVNPDGSMQAPLNIFDAGWYIKSAKPGAPGASVIDAHASGPTREGLFAYVDTLARGDTMTVERGDGQNFTYRVVATETVPLDTVDMKKVLAPHADVKEGLNLITCAGNWAKDRKTFDHRTIVYTERVT